MPKFINYASVGICIIFLSWITQNFFQAEYLSKKDDFILDKTFVDTEMGIIGQYSILFNTERLKTDGNIEIIFNAASNIIRRQAQVLVLMEKYHDKELVKDQLTYTKLMKLHEELLGYVKTGNKEKIISLGVFATIGFMSVDASTRSAIKQYYSSIVSKEEKWRLIHLAFYIIGSLLTAVGYIKSQKAIEDANKAN